VRASATPSSDKSRLGITVSALTPENTAGAAEVQSGVLVTSVDPQGVAAVAGISEGDVITGFNQKPVTSVSDLAELVRDAPADKSVAVLLHRNSSPLFTAVTLH